MDAGVFLQAQTWLTPGTNSPPPPDTHLPLTTKTRFHICLEEQHIPAAAAGTTDTPWHGLSHPSAVNIRLRLPDGSCKATLDATVLCTTQQQQQQQQDGSPEAAALHICWHGQTFAVKHQHIHKVCHLCTDPYHCNTVSPGSHHLCLERCCSKQPGKRPYPLAADVAADTDLRRPACLLARPQVVCSSDIAAAAASLQPQHVTACLIAPAVPQGAQQPQYAHVAWVSLITRHVCLDIMVQDSSDHVQQLAR
jgi:hypothetical protein